MTCYRDFITADSSMGMAVGSLTAGHFFNGDNATVEHLATGVFKLDGCVTNVEMVLEYVVELD
jgi:hypothetical protein